MEFIIILAVLSYIFFAEKKQTPENKQNKKNAPKNLEKEMLEEIEFARRKKVIADLERQGIIRNVKEKNGETTFTCSPELLPSLKGMGLID